MQACPSCNAELAPGSRFCAQCGTPVAAREAEGEGELRQLTALFCDLVGSTRLASGLDPEEFGELVHWYNERAVEVVARYGGHVVRYLGDGLLVDFGWPEAHDDDPERAVRAGLEIVEAIAALSEELSSDDPLAVRIGIHTGPVVYSDAGGREQPQTMALGHTMNLAARLQGVAEPGMVVVSDATRRLVRGLFEFEDLGAQSLKGVPEQVAAWRVAGTTAVRGRLAAADALTPFVGRAAELATVTDRWSRACAGRGQAVLVIGEPGVGKSRLARELRERVGIDRDAWFECTCSSYTQNSAFRPIVDLVARTIGLDPGAESDERLAKLEASLAAAGVHEEDAVALLAALLSIPVADGFDLGGMSPTMQRRRTIEALSGWLLGLAREQPAVFFAEDLHWCDPSSLEVLGDVIARCPTTNLMVVATARREFEPPWPSHSHVTPVTLAALADAEIHAIVDGLSPGRDLPESVVDRIAREADGIPLYAEEIGRMVMESGMLAERGDRWELTAALDELEIPSTLQDSLMARLDRLNTAKRIAQRASIIGRHFSYPLLEAVAGLDLESLREGLERLVDAEVLFQRGEPPEASFSFKHAMIQDAAYRSLLKRKRRELHARVAHALEHDLPGDPDAQLEIIARHYEAAGELVSAVAAYERAAQQAAHHSGHREQLAQLRHAIELLGALPDDEDRRRRELELQIEYASAVMTLRGYADPELQTSYERARALAEALGDEQRLGQALVGLSIYHSNDGLIDLGEELATDALAIAEKRDDDELRLLARVQLALPAYFNARYAQAGAHAEAAAAVYDPERHHSVAYRFGTDQGVAANCFAAYATYHTGRVDEALARARYAGELARSLDRPFDLVYALYFEATLHWGVRDYERVLAVSERVVAICEEQGFDMWRSFGRMVAGTARIMLSRDPSLMGELLEAGREASTMGARAGLPFMTGLVVEAQLATGLLEVTEGLLDMVDNVAEETGQRYWSAENMRLRGELRCAVDGSAARAEELFRRAMVIAEEQDSAPMALRAATRLAAALLDRGERAEADVILRRARARIEGGETLRDVLEAEALLASAQPVENPSPG